MTTTPLRSTDDHRCYTCSNDGNMSCTVEIVDFDKLDSGIKVETTVWHCSHCGGKETEFFSILDLSKAIAVHLSGQFDHLNQQQTELLGKLLEGLADDKYDPSTDILFWVYDGGKECFVHNTFKKELQAICRLMGVDTSGGNAMNWIKEMESGAKRPNLLWLGPSRGR